MLSLSGQITFVTRLDVLLRYFQAPHLQYRGTEWCSRPSKPCCSRPCPAATAVFLGEEQQAYMKTCNARVIPSTTERVCRVRGPLPCQLFRGQLQLPPMRSLQHCLPSLGLHDPFSACVSLELADRNLTHPETVPCEQQTV